MTVMQPVKILRIPMPKTQSPSVLAVHIACLSWSTASTVRGLRSAGVRRPGCQLDIRDWQCSCFSTAISRAPAPSLAVQWLTDARRRKLRKGEHCLGMLLGSPICDDAEQVDAVIAVLLDTPRLTEMMADGRGVQILHCRTDVRQTISSLYSVPV